MIEILKEATALMFEVLKMSVVALFLLTVIWIAIMCISNIVSDAKNGFHSKRR